MAITTSSSIRVKPFSFFAGMVALQEEHISIRLVISILQQKIQDFHFVTAVEGVLIGIAVPTGGAQVRTRELF